MAKVKSAERTLRLLELIASSKNGLTYTEIKENLNIPKSSTFNLIEEFMDNNYLIYNENLRKYFVGMGFIRMCTKGMGNIDVITEINLCVNQLCEQLGETIHAGIIDGRFIVYISKVESGNDASISLIRQIGMKIPAHCTSIGKMLLSEYNDEKIRDLYKNVEMEKMTENTILNVEELIVELHKIKEQGYAIDLHETSPLASCISMPIYQNGLMIAAFSVTIPNYRFSDEYKNKILDKLKETKNEIEDRIK